MNKLDLQYQALLKDILENGVTKKDRTGTGTISVFGRQIRHKMRDGFPLLTTKKMYFKGIVTELLWFLKGDTNIRFLVDNGCHIWDGDCFSNYQKEFKKIHYHTAQMSKEEFIERIKTDDEFAKKWGDLGPVYGKQWRNWEYGESISYMGEIPSRKFIDQIANLIKDLKTNPDSRRLMVTAWNPADLPHQVLPPCHYGFQVYTRELSTKERWEWYGKNGGPNCEINLIDMIVYENEEDNSHIKSWMEKWAPNVPTRAISLMWNQRSVDTFLGLPFNIASYGLLLQIIANVVNMVPDELIGNLGDTHLYLNHVEQAKEQLGRDLTFEERLVLASSEPSFDALDAFGIGELEETKSHEILDEYGIPRRSRVPFELPGLTDLTPIEVREIISQDCDFSKLNISDFALSNYMHHPTIKADLSN
jgi:thymidylate synthase